MSDLKEEWMRRLKPIKAPSGFAHGVLARVRFEEERKARVTAREFRGLWPALVSALLLLCVGTGLLVGIERQAHRDQQREMAAVNQARFEQAMRITSRTLEHVQERVSLAGLKRRRGSKNDAKETR